MNPCILSFELNLRAWLFIHALNLITCMQSISTLLVLIPLPTDGIDYLMAVFTAKVLSKLLYHLQALIYC